MVDYGKTNHLAKKIYVSLPNTCSRIAQFIRLHGMYISRLETKLYSIIKLPISWRHSCTLSSTSQPNTMKTCYQENEEGRLRNKFLGKSGAQKLFFFFLLMILKNLKTSHPGLPQDGTGLSSWSDRKSISQKFWLVILQHP